MAPSSAGQFTAVRPCAAVGSSPVQVLPTGIVLQITFALPLTAAAQAQARAAWPALATLTSSPHADVVLSLASLGPNSASFTIAVPPGFAGQIAVAPAPSLAALVAAPGIAGVGGTLTLSTDASAPAPALSAAGPRVFTCGGTAQATLSFGKPIVGGASAMQAGLLVQGPGAGTVAAYDDARGLFTVAVTAHAPDEVVYVSVESASVEDTYGNPCLATPQPLSFMCTAAAVSGQTLGNAAAVAAAAAPSVAAASSVAATVVAVQAAVGGAGGGGAVAAASAVSAARIAAVAGAMQSVGGCHALLPPLVSASVSDFTNAVGTAFNMVWPAPTDALVPSGGTTAIAGSTATGRRLLESGGSSSALTPAQLAAVRQAARQVFWCVALGAGLAAAHLLAFLALGLDTPGRRFERALGAVAGARHRVTRAASQLRLYLPLASERSMRVAAAPADPEASSLGPGGGARLSLASPSALKYMSPAASPHGLPPTALDTPSPVPFSPPPVRLRPWASPRDGRRRVAPPMLSWPKPELFLASLVLPVTCQAAGTLLNLQAWQAVLVAALVLLALTLPVFFLGLTLVTALQLLAYPQERILVYEVTPEEAREARWPVPVLSGFGFFRRKPQGEWRGASPLGRFLAESCSVFFDGLAGPAVVRAGATFAVDAMGPAPMDRGVLVPVPPPARRKASDQAGEKEGIDDASRATDARRWQTLQHGGLLTAVYRSGYGLVALGLMGAAAASGQSQVPLVPTLAITAMSALGLALDVAFSPLKSAVDQLMDALGAVAELMLYTSILAAQVHEVRNRGTDREKLLFAKAISLYILVAAAFVVVVQVVGQVYQVATLAAPLFRAATRALRRVPLARRVLVRRILRDPHVLAAKYANRWANRVLKRPLRGWPWLVSEEEMQRAAARVPGKAAAAFAQDLERAISWSGLDSEGRLLRALRVRGSAPAWARVGGSVGLTEEARLEALRDGQRTHRMRLVRDRALRRAAVPAALVAEEGDVEVRHVDKGKGYVEAKVTQRWGEGAEGDGDGAVARAQRGSSGMLLLAREGGEPATLRARPGPLSGMVQRARAAVAGMGATVGWGRGRQRGSVVGAGSSSGALPVVGEVESGHRDGAGGRVREGVSAMWLPAERGTEPLAGRQGGGEEARDIGKWAGSGMGRGEGGDEAVGLSTERGVRGMRPLVKKPSLVHGDWSRPGLSPSQTAGPSPAYPAVPWVTDAGQPGSGVDNSPQSAARGTGAALLSRGQEGGTGDERGVLARRSSRGKSGVWLLVKKPGLGRGDWARLRPSGQARPDQGAGVGMASVAVAGGDEGARAAEDSPATVGARGGDGSAGGGVVVRPSRGSSGVRLLSPRDGGAGGGEHGGARGPLSPLSNGPAGSQPRDLPRTGLLPTLSLSR